MSPISSARRVDRLFAAAIGVNALLAAVVGGIAGRPWPGLLAAAAAVSAVGAWVALRKSGTAWGCWLLAGLLGATAWATTALQPQWPELYLNLFLVMSLLPMYRRWPIVLTAGLLFAAAPFVAGTEYREMGRWLFCAFLLAQTVLLALVARRSERQSREIFDIDFLVRAMGQQGAIRLDLGVLRAETALGQRLKDVQERVANTLAQVQQSVGAATAAAGALQTSGQELSSRTEVAGTELNNAAMTLSQIAVIVKGSADAAMTARQTAQAASALAQDGSRIVGQMVGQMQAIDAASRRITDIIGVIENIAFQTNMLALNAAVEAARAGEQGRGFAVVAAEVRMLAKRASVAASEVKGLVENSLDAVSRGNDLASAVGKTMTELTGSVSRVDEVFHSLSADTNEHAAGIEAIRDTMNELNAATRRNLEVAEQSQRIADDLADRAAGLRESMAAFRLERASGSAQAPGPAEAAAAAPGRSARTTRPPVGSDAAAAAPEAAAVEFF